jgi:hypothetical protein
VAVTPRPAKLVGNRLALIGAIIYLSEFAGFAAAGTVVPSGARYRGASSEAIVATYAGHFDGVGLLASWLSLVLLGRIAFAAGLRFALRRSGAEYAVADLAFAAMAVSVILEISGYAVAAGAAQVAAAGGNPSIVVALDAAANWLVMLIFAPQGVFIFFSALAMRWSGLFPRWVAWLGLAAGAGEMLYGLLTGPAFAAGGTLLNFLPVLGFSGLAFWIWMLATGIILFRRADSSSIA